VRRPALTVLAAAAAASTLLAGCGSSSGGSSAGSSGGTSTTSSTASGNITVLAAASLTEAFTTLGHAFEAAHPGSRVVFSFGASSTLATQILQGAPADVFASAAAKNMDQVISGKAAAASSTFARNVMEIAVPPDNPAHITSVADLARPGVKVALCAAVVPCGTGARQVFTRAGVKVTPVTEEADVKSTLTKVELGEVDAGVVYVTDVRSAAGKVTGITVPADVNASTAYPIAALTGSKDPTLAKEFVDYVLSADGTAVLAAAGFAKP
jgi:molybdate transport system substrate-binding protein